MPLNSVRMTVLEASLPPRCDRGPMGAQDHTDLIKLSRTMIGQLNAHITLKQGKRHPKAGQENLQRLSSGVLVEWKVVHHFVMAYG